MGRILSYKICQHFNKLVQIGEKATAERSEQGPSAKKIIFTFIALISPILFQSSHNITQGSVGWALQGPRDPPEEALDAKQCGEGCGAYSLGLPHLALAGGPKTLSLLRFF